MTPSEEFEKHLKIETRAFWGIAALAGFGFVGVVALSFAFLA